MPTFVAYNEDNCPVDIVQAKTKEMANIFWQGKGIVPISVREFNDAALQSHPTGVVSILSTVTKDGHTMRDANTKSKYVLVRK